MDFNIKKPSHLIALILLLVTLLFLIISPILSFFNILPNTKTIETEDIQEPMKAVVEVIALILQIIIVITLTVIIPLIWYYVVNKHTLKEIFCRLKLHSKKIDEAFLWGILSAVSILLIIIGFTFLFMNLGVDFEETSNIPDLERFFSISSMFFLITIQPVGEEIFFRGFLLDKIGSYAGSKMAILVTAILFGLAHMSYGKIYPVILPILIGIILGAVVIKTKNLYSAITAHILFNITSFILYIAGQALLQDSALIL